MKNLLLDTKKVSFLSKNTWLYIPTPRYVSSLYWVFLQIIKQKCCIGKETGKRETEIITRDLLLICTILCPVNYYSKVTGSPLSVCLSVA